MAKERILIEFTPERLDRVFYETRAAIDSVINQCGLDESKLKIAIPKYFIEMINSNRFIHFLETPFLLSDDKITFFGIEVTLNYDNFIVVFHEDMPMFLENYYEVIDLK